MSIQRCAIVSVLFCLFLFPGPQVLAQDRDVTAAKVSWLFDNFMRRGDLPWEFEIGIRKTGQMRSGAYIGAVLARNAMINIGGRMEPALVLKAYLNNLRPGLHAVSIHQYPDCGPKEKDGVIVPGLAAGPHAFAARKTGLEVVSYDANMGNLPNLFVRADGVSVQEIIAPRLNLADLANRSVVINATPDSNSPVEACGVLY